MKGSPWRSGELSWPICHSDLLAHEDPKWPPAASACQTAANLVFGDGQEGRRRERERGGFRVGTHKGGHELPSPPLISVSDKVEQRVHSGPHNKSIRE